MGPTWGPHGSCRPQMGPMLAPWTLLSGIFILIAVNEIPHSNVRRNWNHNITHLVHTNLHYITTADEEHSVQALVYKCFSTCNINPNWRDAGLYIIIDMDVFCPKHALHISVATQFTFQQFIYLCYIICRHNVPFHTAPHANYSFMIFDILQESETPAKKKQIKKH